MRTLYVTDLDGTLLTPQATVSAYSCRVINALVRQGMLFTYATARSLASASIATRGLATSIPVIAYNGAFIVQPQTGQVLAKQVFAPEERQHAVATLRRFGAHPLVYALLDGQEKVSWLAGHENDGMRRYIASRPGDSRMRPLPTDGALFDGEIFYFTCIGERNALQPLYECFAADERYTCTFYQELYRPEWWCEIMPRLATKARAAQTLADLWHCDRIIAFGDEVNDIPLFQAATECYAVANAVPRLKQLATGTIAANDADGVARWLEAHAHLPHPEF